MTASDRRRSTRWATGADIHPARRPGPSGVAACGLSPASDNPHPARHDAMTQVTQPADLSLPRRLRNHNDPDQRHLRHCVTRTGREGRETWGLSSPGPRRGGDRRAGLRDGGCADHQRVPVDGQPCICAVVQQGRGWPHHPGFEPTAIRRPASREPKPTVSHCCRERATP